MHYLKADAKYRCVYTHLHITHACAHIWVSISSLHPWYPLIYCTTFHDDLTPFIWDMMACKTDQSCVHFFTSNTCTCTWTCPWILWINSRDQSEHTRKVSWRLDLISQAIEILNDFLHILIEIWQLFVCPFAHLSISPVTQCKCRPSQRLRCWCACGEPGLLVVLAWICA